jgi:hypothetical protein
MGDSPSKYEELNSAEEDPNIVETSWGELLWERRWNIGFVLMFTTMWQTLPATYVARWDICVYVSRVARPVSPVCKQNGLVG